MSNKNTADIKGLTVIARSLLRDLIRHMEVLEKDYGAFTMLERQARDFREYPPITLKMLEGYQLKVTKSEVF